ncbi:hypothetical protein BDV93DRAFT_566819 [Ceratobasidium sp. AG-I]|nr:hypothetical protein BDV93DRAFT_566819 [Ceratobasidium sp. AG-I]
MSWVADRTAESRRHQADSDRLADDLRVALDDRDDLEIRLREATEEVKRLREDLRAARGRADSRSTDRPTAGLPDRRVTPIPSGRAQPAPALSRRSLANRMDDPPEASSSRPRAPPGESHVAADRNLAQRMYAALNEETDDDWLRTSTEDESDGSDVRGKGKRAKRKTKRKAPAKAQRPPMAERPPLADYRLTPEGEREGRRPWSSRSRGPSPARGAREPVRGGPPGLRHSQPSSSLLPRTPPRPTARGNWVLIRGSWVNEGLGRIADRWRTATDHEVADVFSQPRHAEAGATTEAQRDFLEVARATPKPSRSALQTAIIRDAAALSGWSNHPLVPRPSFNPGVRLGCNGFWCPSDFNAQRFFNALRTVHNASDGRGRTYARMIDIMWDQVLARPGRYAELVLRFFPNAPAEDDGDDAAATVINADHLFPTNGLDSALDISEEDVVRFMWTTLRIPRWAAQLVLEPFARRSVRHGIAMSLWRERVEAEVGTHRRPVFPRITDQEACDRFIGRESCDYALYKGAVISPGDIFLWKLPHSTLYHTVNEVDADLSWLPTAVRAEFTDAYRDRSDASEMDPAHGDAAGVPPPSPPYAHTPRRDRDDEDPL